MLGRVRGLSLRFCWSRLGWGCCSGGKGREGRVLSLVGRMGNSDCDLTSKDCC